MYNEKDFQNAYNFAKELTTHNLVKAIEHYEQEINRARAKQDGYRQQLRDREKNI